MHLLSSRILLASAVALSLACSQERPQAPSTDADPILHEPWEDREAEDIACMISGEFCAPRLLYERVHHELITLRQRWGDSIPSVHQIIAISPSVVPQYGVSMDMGARAEVENGTHLAWDSLVHFLRADVIGSYVYVPYRVNDWRIFESFEKIRGVTNIWPRVIQFDGSRLYAHEEGETLGYLFREASGDCLAGCGVNEYHYFRSQNDSIHYVGSWLKSWPEALEPEWWAIAREAEVLWREGDAQYRFRDTTPPSRVTDLHTIGHQFASTLELQFTAPGDVGLSPHPTSYVFKWSPDSITEANWYQLPYETVPAERAGTQVIVTLGTLPSSGRIVIAMRSVDKLGNVSRVSNSVITENVLQFGWTTYNVANSHLRDSQVTALYVDRQDRAWVGTKTGLTVISNGNSETFSSSDHSVLIDPVTAITEDELGDIWVGSYSGAASYNGLDWTTRWPSSEPAPASAEVRCLSPGGDGSMWMGVGFMGVVNLTSQGWKQYDSSNSGVRGSVVRQIMRSTEGTIWIAGDQGLSSFNGSDWIGHGPQKVISSITETESRSILFGTHDGYLYRLSGSEVTGAPRMKPYESYPRQSPGIPDIVQSDDGSVWLTTYGSVRRYSSDSLLELLVMLPENSPLPEREITALAISSDQVLWIGARNSGVCSWDLKAAGIGHPLQTASVEHGTGRSDLH